jgi:hypothetical protein
VEIETTTGSRDSGTADNETALAPSLSGWFDLGGWWALSFQAGVECPLRSGDSELFVRSALIKTFGCCGEDHGNTKEDHSDHIDAHSPGLVSLIFETDLAVGLGGGEDGEWTAEGIVGIAGELCENVDGRIGYQFPLSGTQELYSGVICGLIYHF